METDNDVKNEPGETSKNVSISNGIGQNEGSERLVETSEVEVSEQGDIDRLSSLSEKIEILTVRWESLWAELQIKYCWSADGRTFSCHALNYIVNDSGGNSGNIKLSFNSRSSWGEDQLTDSAHQDGNWHSITGGGSVDGNVEQAFIKFRYIFDRSGTWDPTAEKYIWVYFEPNTPTLDYRTINIMDRTFVVRGAGGVYRYGTIYLHNASGNAELGTAVVQSDGRWEANISLPSGANSMTFYAKQKIGSKFSENSIGSTAYLAAITAPTPGSVLVPGNVFKGIGLPGTRVRVFRDDTSVKLTEDTTVTGEATWEASLVAMPSSLVPVRADFSGSTSPPVSTLIAWYSILGKPIVSYPVAGSVQDINFQVSGSNGLIGAQVHLLKDLSQSEEYGSSIVEDAAGSWSVMVTVPPGPLSLVAEQVLDGVSSGRSTARFFKIRPPKLVVNVAYPDDKTVRFSGVGYTGATVEIWYKGGVGGVQWAALVVNSSWEKDVTDWLPGSYVMSVRQSVPDNSTPIYSEWSDDVPVAVPVRKPTLNQPTDLPSQKPRFSGTGTTWPDQAATKVDVWLNDTAHAAVPQATVNGSSWSVTATEEIAPGSYSVKARQVFGNKASDWVAWFGNMIIPAPLPRIVSILHEALSPRISGTCWPGAVVNVTFSDSATVHPAEATAGTWELRRDPSFVPGVEHRVTVTQTFGGQTSNPVSETFTVTIPQPVITRPIDEQVDYRPILEGHGGIDGAVMKVFDYVTEQPLGEAAVTGDGWSVRLNPLAFGPHTVYARQFFGDPGSVPSERVSFEVVLLAPDIDVPQPGDDVARAFRIEGRGRPGAEVEVWLEGSPRPLMCVPVRDDGFWWYGATLPLGPCTLRVKQFYDREESEFGADHALRVVPAKPVIDTPAAGQPVGRGVAISGFGYPGDTVTLAWTDALDRPFHSDVVKENSTWSFPVELEGSAGERRFVAQQSFDGYLSGWSGERPIVLRSDPPTFTAPQPGQWVPARPMFAGTARPDAPLELVAWYNADKVLALDVPNTGNGDWQTESEQDLPWGAGWAMARQTGGDGGPASDWGDSARFEVLPPEGLPGS
ncbi:hypothetical protein [Pseudomonas frederiksbergensis]|uniref:hypothetical protein n=1 Tax=Pseudomonas frederiksbergensis TaxID=104087 RepID=UPI003D1AD73C